MFSKIVKTVTKNDFKVEGIENGYSNHLRHTNVLPTRRHLVKIKIKFLNTVHDNLVLVCDVYFHQWNWLSDEILGASASSVLTSTK